LPNVYHTSDMDRAYKHETPNRRLDVSSVHRAPDGSTVICKVSPAFEGQNYWESYAIIRVAANDGRFLYLKVQAPLHQYPGAWVSQAVDSGAINGAAEDPELAAEYERRSNPRGREGNK
jgi:hypothetical protein